MPTALTRSTLTVALVGNPNTGKSTLFGALVGIRQHVANYPGVTVEKKTGRIEYGGRRYDVIDLPGLYSLAARSRDEMVSVDVLLGRRSDVRPVDAVVCIVDASNVQRHLYLVSQVLELGLPTVVAVNMLDVATDRGITLDVKRLGERLGVPAVAIQANRGIGVAELKGALAEALRSGPPSRASLFPETFEREVTRLDEVLGSLDKEDGDATVSLPKPLVRRLLLDTSGYFQRILLAGDNGDLSARTRGLRGPG